MQILEGAGGFEVMGVVQGINHVPLALFHIAFEDLTNLLFDPLAAVDVHIHFSVKDLKNQEVGQARHHRFRPLAEEELFQLVVAQGGELYIDFADHAHGLWSRSFLPEPP